MQQKYLFFFIIYYLLLVATQLCAQSLTDIDADNDGLIEIHNLEMLNAMRYQLDGSGYRSSADTEPNTMGCADGGCRGYELVRDLDFMDNASYASTANKALWTVADYTDSEDTGWQPIGTLSNVFSAAFEGNGYTLSNLMVNRSAVDYVGLFAYTGDTSRVANLSLFKLHVHGRRFAGSLVGFNNRGDITGSSATGVVIGMNSVGGLVGRNFFGSITNSYAMGNVIGESSEVGGLVGWNQGNIANSYATGAVAGKDRLGGLVGWNQGNIANSYATASVAGETSVGGLVGVNIDRITNSYATGSIVGENRLGGLVGLNDGSVTTSYWDRQTSGIETSAGGARKTTVELQSPTAPSGIYSSWSSADWDFGASVNYPILKYAVGSDANNPACGVPKQPACSDLLPKQISFLEGLAVLNGTLSPLFSPERASYDVTVAFDVAQLELQATATDASLRIHSDADGAIRHYKDTAEAAIPLRLGGDTVITVEVGSRPTPYRLSVSYASDDTLKPSTPAVVVESAQPVSEGSPVIVRATLEGSSVCGTNLRCGWAYVDAASRRVEFAATDLRDDSLQLDFRVLTDYVAVAQTSQQLVVVFMVRHRGGLLSVEIPLTVLRENNGSISEEHVELPTLSESTLSAPEIDLADDPDGVNAAPALSYQWQRVKSNAVDLSDPGSWETIDGATDRTYSLADTPFTQRRVQISYTDGQGYNNIVYTQWLRVGDIDIDNDGLIEIHDLGMLDAMRYQLDGSGYRTSVDAEPNTAGCADGGCKGYELVRNLDFLDDASYATSSNKALWTVDDYDDSEDTGWQPIGTQDKTFTAFFEGNDYTLSNLMINRPDADYVGLFGSAGSSATIANLGLSNGRIRGHHDVGSLVGRNEGLITNTSATGTVTGTDSVGGLVGINKGRITDGYAMTTVIGNAFIGGLVGTNFSADIANSRATGVVTGTGNGVGGLVGLSDGRITNSYATGAVAGRGSVGGLVGVNFISIASSYATGAVTGGDHAGGLVGWNGGRITSSYALGIVTGEEQIGGLVGGNFDSIVTSYAIGAVTGTQFVGGLVGLDVSSSGSTPSIVGSYWDLQTSGESQSDGGVGQTTVQLQSPTAATGIYSDWSSEYWNFGSRLHYPILVYTVGSDTDNPACGLSGQAICGEPLPNQLSILDELLVSNGTLSPSFNSEIFSYDVIVNFDATQLELQATATNASLRIHSNAADITVHHKGIANVVIPISLSGDTVISIAVGSRPTRYQLTVSYASDDGAPKSSIVVVDGTQLVSEGSPVTLRATLEGGSICGTDLRCGWAYVDASSRLVEFAAADLRDNSLRLDFRVFTDYVAAGQTSQQLVVVLMVRNRGGLLSVEIPLVVSKQDNGPISEEYIGPPTLSDRTLSAPEIDLRKDPDGMNENPERRYQWQRAQSGAVDLTEPTSWDDIDGATTKTYTLTDTHFSPYRVQLSYTDGQNYANTLYTQWIRIRDIDSDDDGLIEIHNLEMLDAIRHQLDGSGYRESASVAKITTGCTDGGCSGYELARGLDFMADSSYASTTNKALWTVDDYEDSEDTGWRPLGILNEPFDVIFEGNDHTLSNLMINRPAAHNVGLFGRTGSSATIVNLSLLNSDIRGRQSVGGLVGWNEGRIMNSRITGTVAGETNNVGGLVGWNEEGYIRDSYASGDTEGFQRVGGLVGWNHGRVVLSYATGTVTGEGSFVGGLVGWNDGGDIANSYAAATVTGKGVQIGGLVGWNKEGNIVNSYANADVKGDDRGIGGLVGWNEEGYITNSYAAGTVAGKESLVGGLVGDNTGRITNSYATGVVAGKGPRVGGLVGRNIGRIENSYAIGTVMGEEDLLVGGLVGFDVASNGGTPNILSSYWDIQTSGIAISHASSGGTSKTTAELQSPTTATGIYSDWSTVNWNFGSIEDYPILKYAVGPDRNNPLCGAFGQATCGDPLPDQFPERGLLEELVVVNGTLLLPFSPRLFAYDVTVDFDEERLELSTVATGAVMRIRGDASAVEVIGSSTVDAMIPLDLRDATMISIEVTKGDLKPELYRLNVSYSIDSSVSIPSTPVIAVKSDGVSTSVPVMIGEGAVVTIQATLDGASRCDGALRCEWGYSDETSRIAEFAGTELSDDQLQLGFTVLTDYVAASQTTRQLIVAFVARNRGGVVSAQTPFVIMKRDNGVIGLASLTVDGRVLMVPAVNLATDPDGVNENSKLRYQWQRAENAPADLSDATSWENIEGATGTTYVVPGGMQAIPHRVRIRYTDGQGYSSTIYSMPFSDPGLRVRLRVFLEAPL